MSRNQFRFAPSSMSVPTLSRWALAILACAVAGMPGAALAQKTSSSAPTFASYRVGIDCLDAPYHHLVVSGPNGGGGSAFWAYTTEGDGETWYREIGTSGYGSATLSVSGSKTTITSATLKGTLVTEDYVDSYYWDDGLQDYIFEYTTGEEHSVAFNLKFKSTGAVRKTSQYEDQEMVVEGTVLLDSQSLRFPTRTWIRAWYR